MGLRVSEVQLLSTAMASSLGSINHSCVSLRHLRCLSASKKGGPNSGQPRCPTLAGLLKKEARDDD